MTLPFSQLSFPEIYEQAIVPPLFRPWVDATLDAVELSRGDQVLDIACGTGIVARVAKERLGAGATVVGVDASPLMIAVARRTAPDIDWREGSAGELPLDAEEQFDVVVCQQGFQFFPDRVAAAREMRRALRSGGRLAVSTWRPDEEIPFGLELRRVAERHAGAIVDRRHGFGDAAALEAVLREVGFRDVQSTKLTRTIRFSDGAVFVRLNAMALVGMTQNAKTMSDDERERMVASIAADSGGVLKRYTDASGLAFEVSTNLATARD
jgi:ubiquinone/menaquinone biosynthesis C-methylase UbiE